MVHMNTRLPSCSQHMICILQCCKIRIITNADILKLLLSLALEILITTLTCIMENKK